MLCRLGLQEVIWECWSGAATQSYSQGDVSDPGLMLAREWIVMTGCRTCRVVRSAVQCSIEGSRGGASWGPREWITLPRGGIRYLGYSRAGWAPLQVGYSAANRMHLTENESAKVGVPTRCEVGRTDFRCICR